MSERWTEQARVESRRRHVALGLLCSATGLVEASKKAERLSSQKGDKEGAAYRAALQAQTALVRASSRRPSGAAAEMALASPLPPSGIPLSPALENHLAEKGRLLEMLRGGLGGRLPPATVDAFLKSAELANETGRLEVDFDGDPCDASVSGVHGSFTMTTGTTRVIKAGTYVVTLVLAAADFTPPSQRPEVDTDALTTASFTKVGGAP